VKAVKYYDERDFLKKITNKNNNIIKFSEPPPPPDDSWVEAVFVTTGLGAIPVLATELLDDDELDDNDDEALDELKEFDELD
jgi:hypothetical protein